MERKQLSRRDFGKLVLAVTGAALLPACAVRTGDPVPYGPFKEATSLDETNFIFASLTARDAQTFAPVEGIDIQGLFNHPENIQLVRVTNSTTQAQLMNLGLGETTSLMAVDATNPTVLFPVRFADPDMLKPQLQALASGTAEQLTIRNRDFFPAFFAQQGIGTPSFSSLEVTSPFRFSAGGRNHYIGANGTEAYTIRAIELRSGVNRSYLAEILDTNGNLVDYQVMSAGSIPPQYRASDHAQVRAHTVDGYMAPTNPAAQFIAELPNTIKNGFDTLLTGETVADVSGTSVVRPLYLMTRPNGNSPMLVAAIEQSGKPLGVTIMFRNTTDGQGYFYHGFRPSMAEDVLGGAVTQNSYEQAQLILSQAYLRAQAKGKELPVLTRFSENGPEVVASEIVLKSTTEFFGNSALATIPTKAAGLLRSTLYPAGMFSVVNGIIPVGVFANLEQHGGCEIVTCAIEAVKIGAARASGMGAGWTGVGEISTVNDWITQTSKAALEGKPKPIFISTEQAELTGQLSNQTDGGVFFSANADPEDSTQFYLNVHPVGEAWTKLVYAAGDEDESLPILPGEAVSVPTMLVDTLPTQEAYINMITMDNTRVAATAFPYRKITQQVGNIREEIFVTTFTTIDGNKKAYYFANRAEVA